MEKRKGVQGEARSGSAPKSHRRSTLRDERLWGESDPLVEQIKDLFDATEIGDDEWAEYERTHDLTTWEFPRRDYHR